MKKLDKFLSDADESHKEFVRKMKYQATVIDEAEKEEKKKKTKGTEINVEPTMDDTYTMAPVEDK